MDYASVLSQYKIEREKGAPIFQGNSRILWQSSLFPDMLLMQLRPTIYSHVNKGPVELCGIDIVRAKLNELLSRSLHSHGIATHLLFTDSAPDSAYVLIQKQQVAPIEIVVKTELSGSPKHIYHQIGDYKTRQGTYLKQLIHAPYVRFDWRNPLPLEDVCMPCGLADYFIDAKQAEDTALKAFQHLYDLFQTVECHLIDICFFMETSGKVICGEVSSDNMRFHYTGDQVAIQSLFAHKAKEYSLEKAQWLLHALQQKESGK